ncbi:uncharacterized protein LOC120637263 isoform X2 [Pararge aegeria]|nr:uncharacterized protein LOC120637263 isoform X2 [Pararge aegeria]XP_039764944.1 uncharacterized protein LOC120637263 isoform X2 [Pararge aegeria]XP_039764945.1 uncharacterized protein LOC120637263 isoform X2 [Pararge aegeria]XP_039764946.1 uncharacterized protein LOC120637263 isoform X2 [Pararge aegeria]XP_039764947.1 uncharacterized protein LOC120637263 isoform X2 [Pararge aegeria]XP_039764948.1 uncharacterized protein LOC120637263 isoform X2 [Pararge aegeria]
MQGSQRVVMFCLLTTVLPAILIISPLYLRNIRYADVMYKVSDSDVIQIHKGQSSIFCEKHSIKMNSSFNAFQMKGKPKLASKKRHIRLRKSMTLPDDTLEYWGFYLFAGSTVELKACSRYDGSKILVVKGDKIFDTCGILESKYKRDPLVVENHGHVSVTLENPKDKKREIIEDNYNNNKLWLGDIPGSKVITKHKRDVVPPPLHNPNTVLDAGVNHGGNALNNSIGPAEDKSVSSFESGLYECYNDNILMNDFFPYSIQCNNTKYLEDIKTLKVVHEVMSDGYYYYIFYSDNDFVNNDIHAIFDIFKPTFQYSNISNSKMCLNRTECVFAVEMFSDELVIVEVPTKDGLNNNDDNVFILTSVCHPRVSVYIFFPVSVLLLILVFAFL